MGRRRGGNKAHWAPFNIDKSSTPETPASQTANKPAVGVTPIVPTVVIEEAADGVTPHEEPAAAAASLPERDMTLSPKAKQLAEAYSAIKLKDSWTLGLFSPLNPARLQAVDFIASIEANAPHLFDGACLHVMLAIEQPYLNAWFWKDPKASGMYTALSETIGDKSYEDKLAYLTALQGYLKDETAQSNTKFGNRQPTTVLSGIEQQIQLLSNAAPAPLAAIA